MRWQKKGLIFNPSVLRWAMNSALQPTPLLFDDWVRIYFGARDECGLSRIGYVDLDIHDLTKIISWSLRPVLDIGEDGCFDENGVVPSVVLRVGKQIYMYYAGYQLGTKVRFSVFGGLAISEDGGETFFRHQKTPVFERTDNETLFRVPHSVILENNRWRAWYGGGSNFIQGKDKSLPVYDIRYTESSTPFAFPDCGEIILKTLGEEYRLGRPYFFKMTHSEYYLFYGYSTELSAYKLGYAFSADGIKWERKDAFIGIDQSVDDWDSKMMAYPSVIRVKDRIYMFYNGNNYGYEGFGMAELESL